MFCFNVVVKYTIYSKISVITKIYLKSIKYNFRIYEAYTNKNYIDYYLFSASIPPTFETHSYYVPPEFYRLG